MCVTSSSQHLFDRRVFPPEILSRLPEATCDGWPIKNLPRFVTKLMRRFI
jgi:hypothetical protein